MEFQKSGVIFDIDGMLFDTTACVESSWRTLGAKHNVDVDELIKHVHERSTIDIVKEFFPDNCKTDAFAEKFDKNLAEVIKRYHAAPGAYRAMEAMGLGAWGVVTSSSSKVWAQKRIKQARISPPRALVTAEDIKNGKPDPEGYLLCASKLGVKPIGPIQFEDIVTGEIVEERILDVVIFVNSVDGVKAGIASGAEVVGVLTPSTSRSELKAAGAQHIIDDLTCTIVGDGFNNVTVHIW
ncbi:hypothetical protein H4S08_003748 [Coemansia sp. RSA 1365]|nr:hypothetical protein H4S08_003748 [Coemansia sp. RSA 1365]